jgi:hypothetical protein
MLIFETKKDLSDLAADLSGRNPNFFCEVGLSHALQKNIIVLARSTEDVPFDLQHLDALFMRRVLQVKRNLKKTSHKW